MEILASKTKNGVTMAAIENCTSNMAEFLFSQGFQNTEKEHMEGLIPNLSVYDEIEVWVKLN